MHIKSLLGTTTEHRYSVHIIFTTFTETHWPVCRRDIFEGCPAWAYTLCPGDSVHSDFSKFYLALVQH